MPNEKRDFGFNKKNYDGPLVLRDEVLEDELRVRDGRSGVIQKAVFLEQLALPAIVESKELVVKTFNESAVGSLELSDETLEVCKYFALKRSSVLFAVNSIESDANKRATWPRSLHAHKPRLSEFDTQLALQYAHSSATRRRGQNSRFYAHRFARRRCLRAHKTRLAARRVHRDERRSRLQRGARLGHNKLRSHTFSAHNPNARAC